LRVRKSLRKGNVHVSFHSSLKAANCVRIACALQHAKQMLASTSSFLTHFLSKLNSFNENQPFKNTPLQRLHRLRCCHSFWIFIQNSSNANDSSAHFLFIFIVLRSVNLPRYLLQPLPKVLNVCRSNTVSPETGILNIHLH
jgi:hypothetical protein